MNETKSKHPGQGSRKQSQSLSAGRQGGGIHSSSLQDLLLVSQIEPSILPHPLSNALMNSAG